MIVNETQRGTMYKKSHVQVNTKMTSNNQEPTVFTKPQSCSFFFSFIEHCVESNLFSCRMPTCGTEAKVAIAEQEKSVAVGTGQRDFLVFFFDG